MTASSAPISDAPPPGLLYQADFITAREEAALLEEFENLEFGEVRMHGVAAKRRVVHFGWNYGYDSWKIHPTEPIPPFLHPLRARCAELAAEQADALEQVLIARYPPGATIGWHRDAPSFGPTVIGVSLKADCVMRFRRKSGTGFITYRRQLAGRSAYVLSGAARSSWQHSITPVQRERFSITFRTVRKSSQA